MLVKDIIDKITDKNGNMYSISIDNNELVFTKYDGATTNLTIGPLKLHDMVTDVDYNCYVSGNTIELENSIEIFESPTQVIRTLSGELYVLSLFENKISMALLNSTNINNNRLRYSRSCSSFYDSFRKIRIYNNIMNSKGSTMYNRYSLEHINDKLIIVDVAENTSVYSI